MAMARLTPDRDRRRRGQRPGRVALSLVSRGHHGRLGALPRVRHGLTTPMASRYPACQQRVLSSGVRILTDMRGAEDLEVPMVRNPGDERARERERRLRGRLAEGD